MMLNLFLKNKSHERYVAKTRKIFFFLICLSDFLFINQISAQTGKFYSSDRDLSNSLINKVYQDKRGFIWIATEDGLNKFDGYRFTVYKHKKDDKSSLLTNYVNTTFEDSKGRFWVLCISGVQLYDPATERFHIVPITYGNGAKQPQTTSSIIERKNKEIWLATYGQGIVCLKDNNHFVPIKELNNKLKSNYIQLIFEDSRQNIWIVDENKGLFRYTPATQKLYHYPTLGQLIPSSDISCICEDKTGTLFFSTFNNGLVKYDRKSKEFKSIPYNTNQHISIKTLTVDKQNKLYIGTEGNGVKVYNKERNRIDDYSYIFEAFDQSTTKVHSILEDRDGNLWLGLFQKGLMIIPVKHYKFNYNGYKSFDKSSIGSGCIMAIRTDDKDVAWIGTDNGGIYSINKQGKQLAHFKETNHNNMTPSNVMCIFEDSEKKFWVGSYFSGLKLMNPQNGQCTTVHLNFPYGKNENKRIYSIIEDKNKNIWIGTYGYGICKLDLSGKIKEHYQSFIIPGDKIKINQLCNDWINCLLEDNTGLLWIGTCNGLSCFNPKTKRFINLFLKSDMLPKAFVHTLLQDSQGLIWIGTAEGLYSFNKKTKSLTTYTTQDGLPSDVICGVEEDKSRNLWISTHCGISKFVRNSGNFINYFASDGIQGNEFTRGAFAKASDGKIYFGGISGVTSFYPKDIIENKKKLRIEITNFFMGDNPLRKGDRSGHTVIMDTTLIDAKQLNLANDNNTFSIEFSTMDFVNPERIIYQYQIKEFGTGWQNTAHGMNRVSYTNLAHNSYTFMVRAKDGDNYSDIRSLKIVISPPWFATIWAKAIWVLLIILFIGVFIMYSITLMHRKQAVAKRKQREQINEAKLQFFINISHEIRTPMTLIISPLEKLIAEKTEKQSIYMMMYRNAQRILRLINQMMDMRKLDKGQMRLKFRETDIVGFINDIMLTFNYPANKRHIKFSFIKELQNADSLKVWIDLNNFDKILMNILSNAFKYTSDGGEITIELKTGRNNLQHGALKNYFEIDISDNGIGIEPGELDKIFDRFYQIDNDATQKNLGTGIGLNLTKQLVLLHHGIIRAENRANNNGTKFIIQLPLGCEHLMAKEIENPETGTALNESEQIRLPEQDLINERNTETEIEAEKIFETKIRKKPNTPYQILIIEDDEEIRHYMIQELSDSFKILESNNGSDGLNIILKEKPDLIISDIMMPGIDGYTLCRKVKQNVNVNSIPVILLTAKTTTEDQMEGLETGADAYIIKPFNTELLRTTIYNLIQNRTRLIKNFSNKNLVDTKIDSIEIKSNDDILMNKIMKYINEHMSDPKLNVGMLAENIGLSRVQLYRKMKELTNQSVSSFIRTIRLKQAGELIKKDGVNISEVAYATGFTSLSHFSSAFREFYGFSPTEYKAKNK
ncbi:MAG: response regulator [Bacteroidaceae bacterium]|nr:response regulator [Bacteroidaceae bacterium]